MDTEKQTELVRLYVRLQEATYALQAHATQVYEMARRLEDQHDGPVVTLKLTLTTHRPGEVNLG